MTVAELIKMLQRCPSDMPVRLAYDSLVCIYEVKEDRCFISRKAGDYTEPGVHLCAMGDEEVEYHRQKEGAERIP